MRKLTTEEFVEKAKAVHGCNYDYSLVKYISLETTIKIICYKCNKIINQNPTSHLRGSGCKLCSMNKVGEQKRLSQDDFVRVAKNIHGNLYDYTNTKYIKNRGKIKIFCNNCNDYFHQIAANHLAGSGCGKCYNKQRRSNFESFKEKAIKIHSNEYNYPKGSYTTNHDKISIVHIKCGFEFFQTPNAHLAGNGCPKCVNKISKPETAWLDSLNIPKENRNKHIRIPTRKRGINVDGFDPITKTCYFFNGDYFHGNPVVYSPDKINRTVGKTYGELYSTSIKNEDLLKSYGFKVVNMWEWDWDKLNGKKRKIYVK